MQRFVEIGPVVQNIFFIFLCSFTIISLKKRGHSFEKKTHAFNESPIHQELLPDKNLKILNDKNDQDNADKHADEKDDNELSDENDDENDN